MKKVFKIFTKIDKNSNDKVTKICEIDMKNTEFVYYNVITLT